MNEPHPTVKVARDLTAIVELSERLEDQAINDANDHLMPGGLAMVALGPVASARTYDDALDDAEQEAIAWAYVNGVDPSKVMPETYEDDHEPPLQTLLFWSEAWRTEHQWPIPKRPTVTTEAAFIRWALDWAWEHEPHFEDFAADVRAVRSTLENMLTAGARPAFRGVPCMYDECKGKRLIRTTVPTRDDKGRKAWRLTDWHCPSCKRSWSEEDYARNIYAAVERQHFAEIADDTWATASRAARRVGRPEATIRVWAFRGDIASLCLTEEGRRWTFVLMADVLNRHQLANERAERQRVAKAAKRGEAV